MQYFEKTSRRNGVIIHYNHEVIALEKLPDSYKVIAKKKKRAAMKKYSPKF
jgi:L-2-hydroxyglutarate oxidase LhgO